MLDQTEGYTTADGRQIGGVLLDLRGITLRFGGVEAIKNISFDIRQGEIRAIIGPNGAGKSSMLNVISGFYVPQDGEVWFKGARRGPMKPYEVARLGIARTFQNIALFDGMSVLDNIMTGRLNKMKSGFLSQAICWGRAEAEEIANREQVEKIIDFLEIQNIRKTPVGRLPYGLKKRVELALSALERIYPGVDIRSHIRGNPICVSWESDENFLGAFKGALPGHYRYNHRMYGHFMQGAMPPEQRGIFMAGDGISWTPAWVEGAVQTALNAVWGVMTHLGGKSPADNPGPGDRFAEWGPVALPG